MSSFTAKDGDGVNFELAAAFDSLTGSYYPISLSATDRPLVSRQLDSLGDGTGTVQITGNYSAAATDFWIEPPAGEIWYIARVIGLMEDATIRADQIGGAALTNGIKLIHEKNSVETDFTSQLGGIKKLGEWGGLVFDVTILNLASGNDFAFWRGTFTNGGSFIVLDGDTNDKLIIRVEDDLTGLVEHYYTAQGFKLVGA